MAGLEAPKYEDNEQTLEELRERIRKTIAFVESVPESAFAGAAEKNVTLSFSPPGKVLAAPTYLLQMAVPNFYFHISMLYALLRHNGVDVGKMDFLGSINWTDA